MAPPASQRTGTKRKLKSASGKLGSSVKRHTKPDKDAKPKHVSFKNQIRSLRRLLSKPDLPDDVRALKQAQIDELEGKMNAAATTEKHRQRHAKTKPVRFFERRKAERILSKTKRALEALPSTEDGDARLAAVKRVEEATMDVNYVKHFPINKKYISLYAKGERKDPKALSKIQRIRQRVADELRARAEERAANAQTHESDDDDDEPVTFDDDFFLESDTE
ncbi:rRNA-processing protein EFG1 [Plasmodiophora brassicae]|uniref:rRNA-processing protein EFG1 n=1 Tax=Plasmodiophora brassicae TaxID=37360 RepID=A0A0G4J2K8_PLABS|nr:hypothetical protein PBRA_002132 [Plasmodiophora brassicae]SPQ93195.1 unnamed protein product [Plasmodiophora brassicae]